MIKILIFMGVFALTGIASFLWRRAAVRKIDELLNKNLNKKISKEQTKKIKRKSLLPTILLVLSVWFFVAQLLTLIFGKSTETEFHVELFAERVDFFGLNLSTTIILTWVAMAALILAALLVRIFIVPKMKDTPSGLQNILEIMVEYITDYSDSQTGHVRLGDNLAAYMMTLALFMVTCAVIELFGLRAPTADITMTFAMALCTFVLINYYGIKKKGLRGRIKGLASPTPLVFPMRIVSDIAIPVSLACRLFGNMLGGMIVIDLLYFALGNFGIIAPSVFGLYFNVFHPLIQAFIFITLSLTFINEAVE